MITIAVSAEGQDCYDIWIIMSGGINRAGECKCVDRANKKSDTSRGLKNDTGNHRTTKGHRPSDHGSYEA
ncbi:hypothetical protein, partial [Paraburkholderia youngii]